MALDADQRANYKLLIYQAWSGNLGRPVSQRSERLRTTFVGATFVSFADANNDRPGNSILIQTDASPTTGFLRLATPTWQEPEAVLARRATKMLGRSAE